MKGKKIVLGVVLTVSLTQIASLANTNNTIQNNIIDSQNLTNTINNSVTDNTTQNINNANNTNSVDNPTTTNNVAGENVTNNVTNNNNAISTFSIPQEESVNTTNEYQRVATRAEKTKEKIDNIKAKDTDTEEDLKQEFAALYRRDVDSVMNRKKGILESIVLRMSRAIVSEPALLEQFTQENGKLDMQRIIDSSEVMYTFLEIVNTLNIKPITTSYISDALASIK